MPSDPLPPAVGATEHLSIALATSVVALPGGRLVDQLDDPAAATRWLIVHSLVPEGTTLLRYCRDHLCALRTELRSVFSAHVDGVAPPASALEAVNRALTRAPSTPLLRFDEPGGFSRSPEHPVTQLVDHAMARIADDAAALLTGDRAALLARCTSAPCDRFFLRTHGRRQWCCTRCGDRVRASRAYARKRGRVPTA